VLSFSDKSSYQIRVDGYNPQYKTGITKEIEFSQRCAEVFPARGGSSKVQLTVDQCAAITMKDKAFDTRERETFWEQSHQGIALKFKERDGWHCVWAMLTECEDEGKVVFRNFDDVYLARSTSPVQKHRRKNSRF